MNYDPANPLIVQGDRSVLVEVDNPRYAEARDALAPFAELEKSPEHIHTYRLTPLSLWNAAAAGMTADAMIDVLRQLQQVPAAGQPADRHRRDRSAAMAGSSWSAHERARCGWSATTGRCWKNWPASRRCASTWANGSTPSSFRDRAGLSRRAQAGADRRRLPGRGPGRLHRRGRPADPPARRWPARGLPFHVRDYQREAADVFYAGGDVRGGSGVIVLPCGAGKTIVGIAAMALMQRIDAGADHQHHGRQAVAPRDPRQDRPRPRTRSPSTPARPRRSAR